MEDNNPEIKWNSQIERILAEEGERALCFSWLHTQSEKVYSRYNNYITLPTIVLSTIAGTASIGSQALFGENLASSFIIGGLSLSVGILNTVSTHFGWAKRTEAHRLASASYSKIHRFILVELSLPRKERMSAYDMLKVMREQLDRLQETSPRIPDIVIDMFKNKFGETTPKVSKPEITNGLDPIQVYVDEPRTSNDGRTPDTLQTLSSVHRPTLFVADNNRTSSSSYNENTT